MYCNNFLLVCLFSCLFVFYFWLFVYIFISLLLFLNLCWFFYSFLCLFAYLFLNLESFSKWTTKYEHNLYIFCMVILFLWLEQICYAGKWLLKWKESNHFNNAQSMEFLCLLWLFYFVPFFLFFFLVLLFV